eukprot:TRINITY_DN25980_c0_g1_i1.p3 TRINITY_DN25980_c0_g1~~TRINITY_DN25980_c0_g1_i1.p3  ORF type:complete len:117 (-),score=15.08 TRINITY_DN25980_c0_g1_i1:103-453(-)
MLLAFHWLLSLPILLFFPPTSAPSSGWHTHYSNGHFVPRPPSAASFLSRPEAGMASAVPPLRFSSVFSAPLSIDNKVVFGSACWGVGCGRTLSTHSGAMEESGGGDGGAARSKIGE